MSEPISGGNSQYCFQIGVAQKCPKLRQVGSVGVRGGAADRPGRGGAVVPDGPVDELRRVGGDAAGVEA